MLALVALGFVVQVSLVGQLSHARDQRTAYAALREQLANATAPVGSAPPGRPVALLEIPAIGVREVVLSGTTSGVLAAGPGHRRDTVLPGQAGVSVMLGRRSAYGGPFRRLPELRPGAEIHTTTGQGRHVYRVTGLRRAGDRQPPPGRSRLTLVTATGPAYLPDGVLRVDAELTTPAQPAAGVAPATPAEQPLTGDPAAWVPVVLWGEALLLAALAVVWLRARWGRWQSWTAGAPLLLALGSAVADSAARLLPNLL